MTIHDGSRTLRAASPLPTGIEAPDHASIVRDNLPPSSVMLIDRYITKAQLHAFMIVFISLAGLTFVVDAFTNIEEFITHGAEAGGLARVLGTYYGYRFISFFDATSPVISLASAMFALSWLERHNELTALLAAGVTRWRIARPTLIFALTISLLAMANREIVLPRIRHHFSRSAQDLKGDAARPFEARYDHKTDILFRGRAARLATASIESPSLHMPTDLSAFGTQIDAAVAAWMPAAESHPAGYLLSGVREPVDIDRITSSDGRGVVLTRATAPWLASGQCFVCSDVSFEQLIGSSNWSQYSSTIELVRAISNPSLGVGAEIPLRVHARFVSPLLDMALAVLGVPLVVGPSRRGVFLAVGLCVLAAVVFFLVIFGCHAMAAAYVVSPSIGAWAPLLILASLASWAAQPMWQ